MISLSDTVNEDEEHKDTGKSTIIQALINARDKLYTQRTSGQGLMIKNEVMKELEEIIQQMGRDADGSPKANNDLITRKELKAAIREALAEAAPKPRTYAQAAAYARPQAPTNSQRNTEQPNDDLEFERERAKRLNELKREQERMEVTLSLRNATPETREQITKMEEKDIVNLLENKAGCKIRGVRTTGRGSGIRIRCSTVEDADILRNTKTENIANGVTIAERMFTIVIDGVSKYDVDFKKDKQEDLCSRIEYANCGRIKIHGVGPLLQRPRNPDATTQSIRIDTKSADEADDAMEYGIVIGSRIYRARRYTPECQVTRCYNCHEYNHKAESCKNKTKCGRCSQDHRTNECKTTEGSFKCPNCNGNHTAGNRECPSQHRELERMKNKRDAVPLYYRRRC